MEQFNAADMVQMFKEGDLLKAGRWIVRLEREDQRHNGGATVEFFDSHQDPAKFGPMGQFTGARYYAQTLLEGERGRGLCLQGDVPAWSVEPQEYGVIIAWLELQLYNA